MFKNPLKNLEFYLNQLDKPILIIQPSFFQTIGCSRFCAKCCAGTTLDYPDKQFVEFALKHNRHVLFFTRHFSFGIWWNSFTDNHRSVCGYYKTGKGCGNRAKPFLCRFRPNIFHTLRNEIKLSRKFYTNLSKIKIDDRTCNLRSYGLDASYADAKLFRELHQLYILKTERECLNLQRFIQDLEDQVFYILKDNESIYYYKGSRVTKKFLQNLKENYEKGIGII